jgi:hypothetical protein
MCRLEKPLMSAFCGVVAFALTVEKGGWKGGFGLPKASFSSRRVRQAEVARYDSAMSQGVK